MDCSTRHRWQHSTLLLSVSVITCGCMALRWTPMPFCCFMIRPRWPLTIRQHLTSDLWRVTGRAGTLPPRISGSAGSLVEARWFRTETHLQQPEIRLVAGGDAQPFLLEASDGFFERLRCLQLASGGQVIPLRQKAGQFFAQASDKPQHFG
eukprot:TRINITY_DN21250_c0_g1_i2.p1 TRINITY_DN21250_c0_g1~~TRINITY_DN21250_c0_g1_i2.p1  ORF type:complete len:151 (-),score=13.93 TRINITY_DN21250_c0_g1_i2:37-489(-)